MMKYTFVPGPKAHLAEDPEGGLWVKAADVAAIIDDYHRAIALTERFDQVVTKYQEALAASLDTTRQVWREVGRERAMQAELVDRRLRKAYRQASS